MKVDEETRAGDASSVITGCFHLFALFLAALQARGAGAVAAMTERRQSS